MTSEEMMQRIASRMVDDIADEMLEKINPLPTFTTSGVLMHYGFYEIHTKRRPFANIAIAQGGKDDQ